MRDLLKFAVVAVLLTVGLTAGAAAQPLATDSAAADKSALAISPAIVEYVVRPTEKKQFTLQVTNLTEFPLPISGTVKSFDTLEDLEDPSKRALYDASKWFTIEEPGFILQPKQTKTVRVGVLAPDGASPGGHYATIYFQPLLPQDVLTPSTSYLSARVGSLAFLIVPGNLDEKLTVTKFTTSRLHLVRPIDFALGYKNSGNVHISPNSTVRIRNMFGQEAGVIQARPGVVVPGTSKQSVASLDQNLPFGRYTAIAETTFGGDQGFELRRIETVTSFWVVPWSVLLITPLLLGALVVFIRTRGRWKQAFRILRGKTGA